MGVVRRLLTILLFGVLVACGRGGESPGAAPGSAARSPVVCTVNYPLAWAAEQLAGEWVEVRFPAPADIDPAFWQPGPEQVARCQQADLILVNGAAYARWLARVSLPENRLLDTSRAFTDRLIPLDNGPVHSHGPEGDHSHGEMAFTVWLDLDLYGQQVQAIAAALAQLIPERADAIARREGDLLTRLIDMDGELRELARQLDGAPVLYSHPVYQYLESRYGLNGRSLHWEPDQFPVAGEWSALEGLLARHPARLMLWEDEPLPETRSRLQALGIAVVVFRPLGNCPVRGDFASGLSDNIAALRQASDNNVD